MTSPEQTPEEQRPPAPETAPEVEELSAARPTPEAEGPPSARPVVPARPLSYWVAFLLLFLLVGSVVVNLVLFIFMSAGSGAFGAPAVRNPMREVTLEGAGSDKILVLPIEGIISGQDAVSLMGQVENTPGKVKRFLAQARADTKVKAVILSINSPGGGVTASDKAWTHIERFKADRPDVKVVAYFDELAASGGYYVGCGAHHIVAHQTNISGSIGVIMSGYNVAELMRKIGVEPRVLKSSKSDLKDLMSMYRPMTPEERAIMQGVIDEMYDRFVDVVAQGRSNLSRDAVVKLADGRIYTAAQAQDVGLVDQVGTFEEAVAKAKSLVGISGDALLVTYRRQPTLLEALGGAGVSGPASPSQGLRVTIDVPAIADADRPRLMYLWTGRSR